ncbi:unnamed protein product [Ilex paraguariensis]|uniref:Cold-regulated protein n=1 Tax=Ilex paraguariensis TaxID=185542 RepID=A0ABC8V230_9AQUA
MTQSHDNLLSGWPLLKVPLVETSPAPPKDKGKGKAKVSKGSNKSPEDKEDERKAKKAIEGEFELVKETIGDTADQVDEGKADEMTKEAAPRANLAKQIEEAI